MIKYSNGLESTTYQTRYENDFLSLGMYLCRGLAFKANCKQSL